MTTYAAIDIGTYSCGLIIYNSKNKKHINKSIKINFADKLVENEILDEYPIKKTLDALQKYNELIIQNNVDMINIVATHACRTASNTQEFIEKAEKIINNKINIISPTKEAELIYYSTNDIFTKKNENSHKRVVFDIGSGSTQIIIKETKNNTTIDTLYIGFGSYTLSKYFKNMNETKKIDLITRINNDIKKFFIKNELNRLCEVIGASGTISTIALKISPNINEPIHGKKFARKDILKICKQELHNKENIQNYFNYTGPLILYLIANNLKCENITVALRGIKEGLINVMLSKNEDLYEYFNITK